MGYNSTILILNDAWGEIQKNPQQFVENLGHAMAQANSRYDGKQVDFRVGNHVNGASVICNDHADFVNLIAVGGNHASILLRTHNGGRHYTPEDRRSLILAAYAKTTSVPVRPERTPVVTELYDALKAVICAADNGNAYTRDELIKHILPILNRAHEAGIRGAGED